MDPQEFALIYAEMNATIAAMEPVEKEHHDMKIGQQLCRILEDYRWDYTYGGIAPRGTLNTDQIQTIHQAEPDRINMEFKIPMWLSEWKGFNWSAASDRERKQFVDAVDVMRRQLAIIMPEHPVNGRVQRWLMNRYDRQAKVFKYDVPDSQLFSSQPTMEKRLKVSKKMEE